MRQFLQTSVIFLLVVVVLLGSVGADQPQKMEPGEQETSGEQQNEKMIFHGSKQKKQVAITFDDGPDEDYTLKILDILKKYHVKATFFLMGKRIHQHIDVVHRMVKDGHTIGNHSWDHVDFTKLSKRAIHQQLEQTNREIEAVTGRAPLFFRPPFGAVNDQVINQIAKEGFSLIYWNVDTTDWKGKSAKQIIRTVDRHTQAGSIILFHSAGGPRALDGTVAGLPKLITLLRKKGYELVTIDQLVQLPAYGE